MKRRTFESLRLGIEAALIASVPQVLPPKLEEKLILAPGESADLGRHFIERIAARVRQRLPQGVKWLAASTLHFDYAAFWGTLYALAHERRPCTRSSEVACSPASSTSSPSPSGAEPS